uniref:sorting nexin-14-like n=1 Tax=Styela clava TaxID=7725 RepID=UPI001939B9F4|nr:sorting nexin-14-like [Styela clava]
MKPIIYKGLCAGIGLFAVIVLTFNTFHYMVIFWSFFAGVALSMLYLSPGYQVPNLLASTSPKKKRILSTDSSDDCSVCGKANCKRERREETLEKLRPWAGINVTEKEDKAVQEFLETLLEKNVWHWYRNLSKEEEFVNELKMALRYFLSVLYRRINKIDLPDVIVKKLIKIAVEHLHVCLCAMDRDKVTQDDILTYYGPRLHKAARSRRSELDYIRGLCDIIMPILLPSQFVEGDIMKSFLREVLSSNVILPGLDAITDPDTLNNLLLIFFDKSLPEEATEPPAPAVSFLEKFAPPDILQNDSAMLQVDLPEILQTQDMLYQFMTFLKTQGAVNILQFCLTVEDFNRRCLAPEQSTEQKQKLHREAKDIYETYCLPESINFIHFEEDIIKELSKIALGTWEEVSQLRTSTLMFRAYEHAYNLLEHLYCPLFYHSDIYYQMICGIRMPGVVKTQVDRENQKQSQDLLSVKQLGLRLKGAFKGSDTSSLNSDYGEMEQDPENEDTDRTSLIDMEEDGTGRQDILLSRDLSTWRVTVEKVEQRREDDGDKFYTFVISIRRINMQADAELPPDWQVSRRYTEFYVLEGKLTEFHGSLAPANLPPKKLFGRSMEFLKDRCPQFESFLKALISKPVLRRSELLYDFLSPDHSGAPSRFGSRFLPEVRLGRFFKRVPNKIIKEKGQHLDTLLQSLVASCEPLKPKAGKYEMPSDDPVVLMDQKIHNEMYADGDWRMDPSEFSLPKPGVQPEIPLDGVCDYILYLSKRVFEVDDWAFHLMVALKMVVHNTVEPFVRNLIQGKINTYKQEHHVIGLIHTFEDLLFNAPEPRTDKDKMERRNSTFAELKDFIPKHFANFVGKEKHETGCDKVFSLLQMPKLNKQLGYLLLDAFLLELFPELVTDDISPSKK